MCPEGSDFYNNESKQCEGCPAGYLYDFDHHHCSACSPPEVLDVNTHSCLEKVAEGTYQTNPSSDNIINGGISKAEHRDNYDENKNDHPDIEDCPA